MPLLPMDPAAQGGGLAPPPMGAPAGLMPPPPPPMPPAAAGAMALAPLAEQQQMALEAFKQQQAQEALQTALAAIAGAPNPMAAAAQTEPGPMVTPGPGEMDPTGGGY